MKIHRSARDHRWATGLPTTFFIGSQPTIPLLGANAIQADPCARVTVIGVHVPPQSDDPIVHDVLTELGKRKGERLFVNPCEQEIAEATPLGFDGRKLTLREYLQSIRHEH